MITEIPMNFTPYEWQVKAFRQFVDNELNGFALLADVGTGKTAEAITILRYLSWNLQGDIKILVIGPSVVIHNWKNEIAKYCIEKDEFGKVYPLSEASKRKTIMKDLCDKKAYGVVVTNYESFDNDEFAKLVTKWKPDVIVCDELHRIKSYKSKRAKTIVNLALGTQFRLGLTGSAILNSPMDIFMQWKFIDHGEAFGTNFFNFRNVYFYDANAKWAGRSNYFPKWEPVQDKFAELTAKIKRSSIRVIKSETLDLPPFIEKTIKLEMSPKQKRTYDQMEKDFIAFVETEDKPAAVVAQLALTKALRLMQIASGFASTDIGGEVAFTENPKLDALEKILTDNESESVIVWCSFKANYQAIGERLTKMGVPHVFLTGEQSAREKQDSIDMFQRKDGVRVIVANRKAGGIGVNLTAASISVVFSRNFSLEEEIQSDGRNYRGGSQIHQNITKINLVMEGTIEEKIVEALQNKQAISDVILDLKKGM
jgi:SNF2 family DNA or RNA helicase